MKSISVVIPNYNGRHLLEKNLPYVYKALNHAKVDDYEIILPDDASTDTSVDFIQKEYPDIKILNNDQNQGFSININKGINAAVKDLVFILNTDMVLEESYLTYCLPYFEQADTFGVMGSVNLAGQKIYKLSLIGLTPYSKNILITAGSSGCPLLLMSGGNSLLDRKKLQELKGFDEAFSPFYGEDDELGIRANRMGWHYYFEGKAQCYHEESSTIRTHNRKKRIKTIAKRNKIYLNYVHLPSIRLFLYFLVQSFKLLVYWIPGKFWFYNSFGGFLKLLKKAKMRRKALKSLPYSFVEATNKVKEMQLDFIKDHHRSA